MAILKANGEPFRERKPFLAEKASKPTLVNIRDLPPENELPSMRHFDLFMPGREDILSFDPKKPGNLNPAVPWNELHDMIGENFWGPWFGYCEKHCPNQHDDYLIYDKVTCMDGLRREFVHMYSNTGLRGFRHMKIYQYEGCIPYQMLDGQFADMEKLVLHRT